MMSMRANPHVDVAGVFEPGAEQRAACQDVEAYDDVHWFESEEELLGADGVDAIASEGANDESLAQTQRIVTAGKHVWYDKPAGNNWEQWQQVVAMARHKGLQLQCGYMFRYHPGFCQIAEWVHGGLLGDIFSIRAHMSTNVAPADRQRMSHFEGGILFDLCGHVLDQVMWLIRERPHKVSSYLRNDTGEVPLFMDNTLAIFEFDGTLAFIDIAAMETPPMARRFEVYGTGGSAIMEPMEPGDRIRLCLAADRDGYSRGEQTVSVETRSRQDLYDLELSAFLEAIAGERQPDRSYDFELLVQETLLRAAGELIAR
jgi:predicted dehydrogenase